MNISWDGRELTVQATLTTMKELDQLIIELGKANALMPSHPTMEDAFHQMKQAQATSRLKGQQFEPSEIEGILRESRKGNHT